MADSPLVSVILAARNEAPRVAAAVESIRAQTLTRWELVVVDDGSEDDTAGVASASGDPRIRVVSRPPSGLTASLNYGIGIARAPLIARQDADDLSLPRRLELQSAFLDSHEEVAAVGTRWLELGPGNRPVRPRRGFVGGEVNRLLTKFNPFIHTSMMFRRASVEAVGGYDERIRFAQDYDLWLRLAHSGAVLWNLDEELVVRHMSGDNISGRNEAAQIRCELGIRWRDIRRRRAAGRPIEQHPREIVRRSVTMVTPQSVKRAKRRLQGKAP